MTAAEIIARAILESQQGFVWNHETAAKAAIDALRDAGLKILPREPTEAMADAATRLMIETGNHMPAALRAAWDAAK